MKEYDAFFLTELNEVRQDTALELTLRDLTPGRAKYRCQRVKARVSGDPNKYRDRLWPRLGRGQWVGEPWSVEVMEEVNPIPEAWR
jgi:phenylphosphate carboxylase gamma subunit